ncbi:MAG: hypothetical protein ABSG44_09135 [Thermodesulfobacteriota bacterium]|jgi:hypothetical protein
MKRRILEIILAFIVGAFTCCAFFSLIGIVIADIEIPLAKLIKWHRFWPKDYHYRIYFALFDSIVFQLFSQIPVTAFSGTFLGLTIAKRPKLNGFVAALGAIAFYIYLDLLSTYSIHKTLGSMREILSWFTIFHLPLIVFWVVLFIAFTSIAYRLKRTGRPLAPQAYSEGKEIPYRVFDKNLINATGLFIAPIILGVAYLCFLLIRTSAFTLFWVADVLAAAAPYVFLWIISLRWPDRAKLCKIASVVIFLLRVLAGIIKYLQSQNSEEAIKAFEISSSEVVVIWVLGVLTLIGMVVMLRKRNSVQ